MSLRGIIFLLRKSFSALHEFTVEWSPKAEIILTVDRREGL